MLRLHGRARAGCVRPTFGLQRLGTADAAVPPCWRAGRHSAAPGCGSSQSSRLRLVSTTTVLLRPWAKLCFTLLCSIAGRLSVRVPPPGRLFGLAVFVVCVRHTLSSGPSAPAWASNVSIRRTPRRSFSASPPLATAACTTFDRPKAKSNSSEWKRTTFSIPGCRQLVKFPAAVGLRLPRHGPASWPVPGPAFPRPS